MLISSCSTAGSYKGKFDFCQRLNAYAAQHPKKQLLTRSERAIAELVDPGLLNVRFTREMPSQWLQLRKLIAEYPSDMTAVNINSIQAFFAGFNLPVTDFIICDEADFSLINEQLKPCGLGADTDMGLYNSALRLAICSKSVKLDKIAIEGMLVHELAHGTSAYDLFCYYKDDGSGRDLVVDPRYGFNFLDYGVFLEEGFAELMRAKYVENLISRGGINSWLGLSGDPVNYLNSTYPWVDDRSGYAYPMPLKYMHKIYHEDGSFFISTAESARAGLGLELLCKKDPGLFAAMIKARKSLAGIQEVAVRINRISRGLYVELERLPDSEEAILQGLKLIIDRVYGGELKIDGRRMIVG